MIIVILYVKLYYDDLLINSNDFYIIYHSLYLITLIITLSYLINFL